MKWNANIIKNGITLLDNIEVELDEIVKSNGMPYWNGNFRAHTNLNLVKERAHSALQIRLSDGRSGNILVTNQTSEDPTKGLPQCFVEFKGNGSLR